MPLLNKEDTSCPESRKPVCQCISLYESTHETLGHLFLLRLPVSVHLRGSMIPPASSQQNCKAVTIIFKNRTKPDTTRHCA